MQFICRLKVTISTYNFQTPAIPLDPRMASRASYICIIDFHLRLLILCRGGVGLLVGRAKMPRSLMMYTGRGFAVPTDHFRIIPFANLARATIWD